MANILRALAFGALASTMVGCGMSPSTAVMPRTVSSAALVAADESDHAQMNAIVKSVLDGYFTALLSGDTTADRNKDGAIAKAEYQKGHSAAATALFFAQFDTNKDGSVNQAEYNAALATGAPVEAYHHFTEEAMSAAIKPYAADKNFEASELRPYMAGIGIGSDWPLIFRVFDKLDLNKDEKLLSDKGEGPAFMLFFARPQLQHELALPVSDIDALSAKKPVSARK